MKIFISLVAAILAVVWSVSGAFADAVSGEASATGGDMLRIGGEQFFLNGITAPENDSAAKTHLEKLLSNVDVTCEVQETTQGSHRTAICSAGDSDVSAAMVRSGLVFAWVENAVDLSDVESEVRASGQGIWGDEGMKLVADGIATGSLPPRDCAIKGNKSRQEPYDLKYHLPEFAYYSRTRINLQGNEQWFCSEADAEAAGFVRAAR